MTTRGDGATGRRAATGHDEAGRRLVAACGFCGTYDEHTAACEASRLPRLHGDYEEYLEEKLTETGLGANEADGLRAELRSIQRLNDQRDRLLGTS